MKKYLVRLFPYIVIFTFGYYLAVKTFPPDQSTGQVASAKSIGVWAFIGGYQFSLYGYTSPNALVSIEGMGIYDQTYSNDAGYFSFTNSFSPFSPREACLTAKDQFGRLSLPTCLPPFPTNDYNVNIGPVLLPPTLSLEKSSYFTGDEIVLSGQAIPDTEISLSMFTDESNSYFDFLSKLNPVKTVQAFTFPELQSRSDNKGNFAVSLPSSQVKHYRLFAQTSFLNFPSNKSITLNLKVLPIWMLIINFLISLFSLLKPRFIEILVISELAIILFYYIRQYFQPHIIAKHKSLMLRTNLALLDEEKELVGY